MNWDIIFPKPQVFGNGKIKIACIGDSITYGYGVIEDRSKTYPALLSQMLGKEYTVKNFGVCNRTATNKYPYGYKYSGLTGKALRFKPDIAVICLGTNDTKPYCWNRERLEKDYSRLVEKFIKIGAKVLVCLPPPCLFDKNINPAHIINCKIIADELQAVLKSIAAKFNASTVDLYSALSGYKLYFPDGIHPNADANKIIAETICKNLRLI